LKEFKGKEPDPQTIIVFSFENFSNFSFSTYFPEDNSLNVRQFEIKNEFRKRFSFFGRYGKKERSANRP
jgi:hypothetical protein